MSLTENIIGYSTTFFVSIINVPQIIYTYRIKSAKEISWGSIFNNIMVGSLGTTYGILIDKPPLYIANSISFLMTSILLYMKCKYNHKKKINPII
tara:strand:+ start:972 stop:1256 length:285 start_codon:yes stop_codon:yes gene_type:complete